MAEKEGGGIKTAFAGAFKGIGSSLGNFGLPFTEQFTKIGESIEGANTKGKTFTATLAGIGKLTTEVGIGAAIGVSAESVHLADQYDTALTQLETAVKNSKNSWSGFQADLKATEARTGALGFNTTETAQALQILTTATNSPKKAVADIGEVMNLARLKGISLSESAQTWPRSTPAARSR